MTGDSKLQKVDNKDPVIMAVLEEIFLVAQIDPACVCPDYRLEKEFGLEPDSIHKILIKTARKLALKLPEGKIHLKEATARQLVNILKECKPIEFKKSA